MNGSEIVLLLFVVRLIIPIGLLMIIGGYMRRKESKDGFK